MIKSPKVSVIVPVYQANRTLRRCVDSLVSQTIDSYEIILVDDGSSDGSQFICDEYSMKYGNVNVIHQTNGGVSSARQIGLDVAEGEYVIFADADDYVESDMLRCLYAEAVRSNADMVICDFYQETRKGQIYIKQKPSAVSHDVVLRDLFINLHGSCCNKLVRRSCFSEYDVSFPLDFDYCEDLFLCASMLKNDIRVTYCAKAFYHYDLTQNTNSITKNQSIAKLDYLKKIRKRFLTLLDGCECYDICDAHRSFDIVYFAFRSGQFDNTQFRTIFKEYGRKALQSHYSILYKSVLLLSSIGFQSPMYYFYNKYFRQ